MSKDTIYRQEAIDEFWKLDIEMRPSAIDAITGILEQLPSAHPEITDELVGFVEWVLDEIWDEELWEYNWQAFPELVCRKLLKLGFVTTNEEGNYERNE